MATREDVGGSMSLDNIPVHDPEHEDFQEKLKHIVVGSVLEHPLSDSPVRTILLIGPTQSGKTQLVQRLSDSLGIPALVLSMAAQSAENFVSTPSYVSVTSSGRAQTMTQMGPPPIAQEVIRLQETIAQAAEAAYSAGKEAGVFRRHIAQALERERQERGFISDPLMRVSGMSDASLKQLIGLTAYINRELHGLPSGWKFAPVLIFVDEANKNPDLLPSLLTLSRDARIGHHKLANIAIFYAMTEGGTNFLRQFYESESLPDFHSRLHTYRIAAGLPGTLQRILNALPAQLEQFQRKVQGLTRDLAGTPLVSQEAGISYLKGSLPPPNLLMRMAQAAVDARLGIGSSWTDTNYETPTNWWRVLAPDSLALYHHIAQKGMTSGASEADIIKAIASEVQARLVAGHEHAPRIAQAVAKAMYDAQQVMVTDRFDLSDASLLRIHASNLRETRTAPWSLSENYADEIKQAIHKFGTVDAREEDREALVDFLSALSRYMKEINDKLPHPIPAGVSEVLPHNELGELVAHITFGIGERIHKDVQKRLSELDIEAHRVNSRDDGTQASEAELDWAQGFRSQRNPFDYIALYPAVRGG